MVHDYMALTVYMITFLKALKFLTCSFAILLIFYLIKSGWKLKGV